jgi:hypothetical protein
MTDFNVGDPVRFHPVIGGNHDGRTYHIKGFTDLGHGERCAFLDGVSGCVSLRALSVPARGLIDPDSPLCVKPLYIVTGA